MATFIGQTKIWTELKVLIPLMQDGLNINLLIQGPSGYGKSRMANIVANTVNEDDTEYILPDKSGDVSIDLNKRIHIIDEAHGLTQPEMLFPLMDSKKYIFIFVSNESGELKEPLVNRCYHYILGDYDVPELMLMVQRLFEGYNYSFPDSFYKLIVDNSNGNPRVALDVISHRLINLFSAYGVPKTIKDLDFLIRDVLNIQDGLDETHRRYLKYLEKVKVASLESISNATHIDRSTIKRNIEPVLLDKGLIRLTSRGRKIVEGLEYL